MVVLSFEASGKIKLPTAEELQEEDAQNAILAYVSGALEGE